MQHPLFIISVNSVSTAAFILTVIVSEPFIEKLHEFIVAQ